MNNKKLKIGILLTLIIVLLSSIAYADLYLNSRTGYINLNTTGETRLQITPGGNLNLIGLVNVSILGNLSVGGNVSVDENTFFVDSSDNRVGIGTSYPNYKLDVDGNVSIGRFIIINDSNTGNPFIQLVNGSDNSYLQITDGIFNINHGGADRLTIDGNGNVGIGTASPNQKLHVKTSDGVQATIEHSDGTNAFLNLSNTGGSAMIGSASNDLTFYTSSTNTEHMRILDGNGNVGIGTASPGHILTVSSGSNDDIALFNGTSGGGNPIIRIQNTGSVWRAPQLRANGNLRFYDQTNDVIVMTLQNSTGNVGIGTTAPGAELHVVGHVNVSKNITIHSGNFIYGGLQNVQRPILGTDTTGHNHTILRSVDSDAGDGINFQNYAGSSLMYIQDAGNVGIGTTSPSELLSVAGNGIFTSSLDVGSPATTGAVLDIGDNSTGSERLRVANSEGYADFGTDNGEGQIWVGGSGPHITIESGGNVGIGTTSPDTLLELEASAPKIQVNGTGSSTIEIIRGSGSDYGTFQLSTEDSIDWEIQTRADLSHPGYLVFRDGAGNNVMVVENNTGNVGIGTTNPERLLQVDGNDADGFSGIILTRSTVGNESEVELLTGGGSAGTEFVLKTNGTEALRVTSPGNVGIGTTGPGNLLHVKGDVGDTPMLNLEHTDANDRLTIDLTHPTKTFKISNNGVALILEDENSADVLAVNNGNVGIGTTAPSNKLEVVGTFNATASGGSGDLIVESDGDVLFNTTAGKEFFFDTSAGFVGIGTASPAQILHIHNLFEGGAGSIGGAIAFARGPGNGTKFQIMTITDSQQTGVDGLAFMEDSTEYMRIENGNVGIGTPNPLTKLHVNGTAGTDSELRLASTTSNNFGRITFYEGTINSWEINGTGANGNLNFVDAYNSRDVMRLTNAGEVLIGTTADSGAYELQVSTDICESDTTLDACSSDVRLKENIADIENATEYLMSLRPRYFNFVGEREVTAGLIAQEVNETRPELLREAADGYYTWKNPGLDMITVKAIQEQQKIIEQQQSQIKQLKQKIAVLETE
jgi:hypothetical protein